MSKNSKVDEKTVEKEKVVEASHLHETKTRSRIGLFSLLRLRHYAYFFNIFLPDVGALTPVA